MVITNLNELDVALNKKRGHLNSNETAQCLHFCYLNAKALFNEARILIKHRHFARGFALCVLSLEELAKIPVMSNAVLLKDSDDAAWDKLWEAFNSHKLKQNIWAAYGDGSRFLKSKPSKHYKDRYPRELPSLEKMKQLSLYVDIVDGSTPMTPDILFGHLKGLVGLVYKMAEGRLKALKPLHGEFKSSRKAVALMSRFQFADLDQKGLESMIFESMKYFRTYHENGPARPSREKVKFRVSKP